MTALEASRVLAVPPGEGRYVDLLDGFGATFKLMAADTGGQLAVVEHPFAVGAWGPPHSHSREDEFSIVVESEIGFRSEDDEIVLGSGLVDDQVRFWVCDTGPGIPPGDQERIFERCARGGDTRRPDGSGLGLAIVQAIARAHGGRVDLVSEPNDATTFTIVLPRDPRRATGHEPHSDRRG